MKNLGNYLVALGLIIATAGQFYMPVWVAISVGALIAAFSGDISAYIRKEQK